MNLHTEKTKNSLDSMFEYPREMYFNLEKKFLPLALTIPNNGLVSNFPENVDSAPALSLEKFSLVVYNDQRFRTFKQPKRTSEYLDLFLESDGKYLDSFILKFLRSMPEENINQLTLDQLSDFTGKKAFFDIFIEDIQRKSNEIDDTKPDSPVRIKGILYDGKFIDIKDTETIQTITNELFDSVSEIAVPNGTELYRSVRANELSQIRKNGKFLIRPDTNFESKIGPQVQMYLKDHEYSGVMVKTKVEGPYFANAGFQVPRISSITALYADVELSTDGMTWLSVKEFNEKNSEKNS